MSYWNTGYWYDFPFHLRQDAPKVPPILRQATNADWTYSPLRIQELRDACGLETVTDYDTRLQRLMASIVQEVASILHQPPVSVERTDRYAGCGPQMALSVPASRKDMEKPQVFYVEDGTETEIDAADIELVGPRLVEVTDPPWATKARIVYHTDVSAFSDVVREAVWAEVGYRFRKTAGETRLEDPNIAMRLRPWAVNRVGFAG